MFIFVQNQGSMNKVFRVFIISIFLLQVQWVKAQDFQVNVYYSQYMQINAEPYIEIYFALNPHTVALAQNSHGQWQGGLDVLVTINKEDKIVAYDKFQLMSQEMIDTMEILPFVFQQSRLSVDQGSYTLNIEMKDMHAGQPPVVINHPFELKIERNLLQASSLLVLDRYSETNKSGIDAKYGIEMVPIVPTGTYFIHEQINKLPFYIELYNTDVVFGEDQSYMLKFYLKDNLSKKVLTSFIGYQKAKGSKVQPMLKEFNISSLKTGYYEIVIDVINTQNEVVKTFATPFYRRNGTADFASVDLKEVQVANTFVEGMRSIDTLGAFIECLFAISTDAERRISENVLKDRDLATMQSYFFNFWKTREPADPNAAWQAYLVEVKFVNSQYGSLSIPGYKTEMGRVYLQYGKPSLIERSDHDPSNYPWQIWQYDILQSASTPVQNNQQFVFVDQALTGRNFRLIHSTALGEMRDDKWQFQLNRHTNRGPDVDAQSTQMGRDNFGYRVNNNFIIGDQRLWFDRQ